jgi:hypothetical protein
MTRWENYALIVDRCGGELEPLQGHDRWGAMQRWRKVYAARLHEATGRWTYRGYDWNVFAAGYARALDGRHAVEEYELQRAAAILICPMREAYPALRLVGGTLPDLRPIYEDITVWPDDLSWTMAFSHEEHCFFSRAEWLASPVTGRHRPRRRW